MNILDWIVAFISSKFDHARALIPFMNNKYEIHDKIHITSPGISTEVFMINRNENYVLRIRIFGYDSAVDVEFDQIKSAEIANFISRFPNIQSSTKL